MEIEGANQFLQFLFRIKEDLLRMLLEESVHAFAFFMIVYDSRGDDEIIDRFLKRDMTAESLQRSELYMLLEWRQACIADGVFKIESNLEFESRQDISSVGRRQ